MYQATDNQENDVRIHALKQQIQALRQKLPYYQLEREARQSAPAHFFERHHQQSLQQVVPQICLQQVQDKAQLEAILKRCLDFPTLIIQLGAASSHSDFNRIYEDLKTIRKALPQHFLMVSDRIVDEYQILTARHAGADGIILNLSELGKNRSKTYCNKVHLWGMEPIMRVKNLSGLEALASLPTRCVWLDAISERESFALKQSRLLKSFFWSGLSISEPLPDSVPEKLQTQQVIVDCSLWQKPDPGIELEHLQRLYPGG